MLIDLTKFSHIFSETMDYFTKLTSVSVEKDILLRYMPLFSFLYSTDEDNSYFSSEDECMYYTFRQVAIKSDKLAKCFRVPKDKVNYQETVVRNSTLNGMGETVPVNSQIDSIVNPSSKNKAQTNSNDNRTVESPEYLKKYYEIIDENNLMETLFEIFKPLFKEFTTIY